jgi:undecaprenyl-diphosphatase
MFFRINKTLIVIFASSLFIYLLSCFGLFDGFSEFIAHSLYNALGYTNKWSHSYGPAWFVGAIGDISALGSREIVLIFSTFMFFYFKMIRGSKAANNFLFTVAFGILLIITTKSITSKHEELYLKSVLIETLSNFPSGHTYIATVLYFAIAKNLSTKLKYEFVNRYLFVSAAIIVAIVGISRFVGAGHTVTEVVAGWSLGLCWYTFAQLFLAIDHKTIFNK